MAMTKREQADMRRLRDDLALARAMRWPDYPNPAPMPQAEIKANLVEGGERYGRRQKVARGWFCNAYNGSLTYGCSDGTHHDSRGDTTGTQGMGIMYRTKADAARAMRLEMTEKFAEKLAAVDRIIADAEAITPISETPDEPR